MALEKTTEWKAEKCLGYDPYLEQPQSAERRAVDEARVKLVMAMDLEENCRRCGDREMELRALRLCLDRTVILGSRLESLRKAVIDTPAVAETKPEW
jgi:hypothetical protein